MSAIQSTPERTHLGTMTKAQAQILLKHRGRIVELRGLLKRAEEDYRDMISLCMPEGANVFDDNTFSFFYEQPAGAPPVELAKEDVEG